MPVIAEFFVRETQDFASLQAAAIVMPIPKPSASKSRDVKSCVSRTINAFIPSISFHSFHCHGLLVRRKILRLYWAIAIERVMREWHMRDACRNA